MKLTFASLRAAYERDVAALVSAPVHADILTDADLIHLPMLVQRYLRTTGAIGQPRVHNFRVRHRGRIRQGPESRWMPFTAEQHNAVGEPARLFYMDASMFLIPFQVFHRYIGAAATMRVKAGRLVLVVDVSGPEMTRAETVTVFNDMCIMAPATLIDPAITWGEVDASTVRATFTNGGYTIGAEVVFNEAGELVNFWSDDRRRSSANGSTLEPVRWSTPWRRIGTSDPSASLRVAKHDGMTQAASTPISRSN